MKRKKYKLGGPKGEGCPFSAAKATSIDYKDVDLLRKFLNRHTNQLLPARKTGVKPKYQRMLTEAVARARHLALIPYHGVDPNAPPPPDDDWRPKPRRRRG